MRLSSMPTMLLKPAVNVAMRQSLCYQSDIITHNLVLYRQKFNRVIAISQSQTQFAERFLPTSRPLQSPWDKKLLWVCSTLNMNLAPGLTYANVEVPGKQTGKTLRKHLAVAIPRISLITANTQRDLYIRSKLHSNQRQFFWHINNLLI